jgi:predicted PurR-regulated permease PerM
MFGLTIAALGIIGQSTRVIGWILTAMILAGIFHPLVDLLDRHVPRGVALAIVMIGSMATVAGMAYVVVDEVANQVNDLQQAVPEAARELEESQRFGEAAREADLADRAERFVDELPERLRGGDVNDALRSAATRGVAFLATTVLTIFALVHGPRLLHSGIGQLPERRQATAYRIGRSVYRRSWTYVVGSLAMAAMAGLLTFACAYALDLPGKAPLALWAALFDLIPLVGLLLGVLPVVLLAGTTSSWEATLVVAAVLVAWQVFEGLRLQRSIERRSVHLGPFVSFVVALVGLDLYGIGGVFVSLVLATLVAVVLDEVLGHGPRSSDPQPSGLT